MGDRNRAIHGSEVIDPLTIDKPLVNRWRSLVFVIATPGSLVVEGVLGSVAGFHPM